MPVSAEPAPLAVAPSMIGGYEVVRKLATGGMGEVYLATQTGPLDFRRKVVLKKLHPRFTADPRFITMFLNEARIAASLAHPNIIHIYELVEDGGGYAIAMEYVRGGSVLALLRGLAGRTSVHVPYGPMVRIATSICDALYYAYNEPDGDGAPRRVIHRDVSPSNVLVGYDGQVKLGDFGIAKALANNGGEQTTTIKGNYGYLPPEQIKCLPLDQRSDLFSLGAMLWEMSVGKRLFRRDNEMQMMYAILEETIPLPSDHVPGYPKQLERVVMKALARARDDRYTDANALAAELREVARDQQWDCEQPALAQLVKDLLPQDPFVSGQSGSASFAPARSPAPREAASSGSRGSWVDADSFASVVIETPPPEPMPGRPWWGLGTLVTVAILLAASAGFWLWIVPMIDP